jgi:hypothetical protein
MVKPGKADGARLIYVTDIDGQVLWEVLSYFMRSVSLQYTRTVVSWSGLESAAHGWTRSGVYIDPSHVRHAPHDGDADGEAHAEIWDLARGMGEV